MNKLRDDILQLAGFINADAKNSRGNRFTRDTTAVCKNTLLTPKQLCILKNARELSLESTSTYNLLFI